MKTKLFSRICGWIMAAVLAGGLFTSCGLTKLADDILNGDGFENYGWTEQGNKLTFRYEWNFLVKIAYEFEFTFDKDDRCISAIEKCTYPDADSAREEYDSLTEAERTNVRLDGKTLIYDLTSEYEDMTKDEVKEIINYTYGDQQ